MIEILSLFYLGDSMEEKILVTQSSMPPYEEYIEEIKELWDSKWLTNCGNLHNKLQSNLQQHLNVSNVELFTNGHLALMVALKSLGLKGEVITTPFTFASTTNAIVDCGLTPVFCDINEFDYTIDADKIEALVTDQTCAIVPVHVYGAVCDVEKIERIAKKHNLKVIYDSAHAFGVSYKGKNVSTFGDISMFSFHATKVFNTIEGGCLSFNDETLKQKIMQYRNFGLNGEQVEVCGINAKMNEFQSAMGLCNLRHNQEEIAKRKLISDCYDNLLAGVKGIKFLTLPDSIVRNYAYYPILIDQSVYGLNRDEVAGLLEKHNIFARKYFYPLTNEFDVYRDKFNGKTPIASKVSKNILCLPMFADLSIDNVKHIVDVLIAKK